MIRQLDFGGAVDLAIDHAMEEDASVVLFVTDPPAHLVRKYGGSRVVRTPISEPAITALAVGAAACGLRPIFFWRNATFGFGAFDQVANQAAKMRFMLGGQVRIPLVIRALYGGGERKAAQHAQTPYGIFAQLPGLKVLTPSTPANGYSLMRAAIHDDDPVMFFEHVRLSSSRGSVDSGLLNRPIGGSTIRRSGSDITVVTLGYMTALALEAAVNLAARGIHAEVLDLESVAPLDRRSIRKSVQKTGLLLVVDEAPPNCSVASEVIASVCDDVDSFRALRQPPARINSLPLPIAYSPELEDSILPKVGDIVEAAIALLAPRDRKAQ